MSNPNVENAPPAPPAPSDFIRDIVAAHVAEEKYPRIHTRFPPEPNGYLHIGHAKSICLNFGIAREFGGICNLRMDDTNPTKEDVEYVESIQADVNWLIRDWADVRLGLKPKGKTAEAVTSDGKPDFYLPAIFGTSEAERQHSDVKLEPFYASDYFEQIYVYAVELVKRGKAFVCDLTPDETDEYRRNAKESPFRNRSVAENLDLFTRMKNGEFPDGKCSLRAKIDVASPNIWMRDPLLYRIRHADHHHTGSKWRIYPTPGLEACPERLSGSIAESNVITLVWSAYRGWEDGVSNYVVEKYDLNGNLIRTVVVADTIFIDNAPDPGNQTVRYVIKPQANEAGVPPSASNMLEFIKNANLYYPTAFTPNGDNLNDGFIVAGQFIQKIHLTILDRWGAVLYSSDKNEPWNGISNGTPMSPSTYIWKAEITDLAGRTFSKEGTVALIR